jgi:hypothetical protein
MVRATAHPPRRKLPWILGGALVVVVLIFGLTYYFGSRTGVHSNPAETVPPASSAAPTEPASTSAADPAPTGCLGGEIRDAAMVLAAQKAAPHTSNGAVEVAAALVRWAYQYPYPSASDADQVSEAIVSSQAPANFRDLAAFYASNPNVSGGLVPDGVNYSMSTVPGVWHLESYSGDSAEVSIGTGLIEDGALSTTLRASATVALTWEDGMWKSGGLGATRTTEELYSIGAAFTGGC